MWGQTLVVVVVCVWGGDRWGCRGVRVDGAEDAGLFWRVFGGVMAVVMSVYAGSLWRSLVIGVVGWGRGHDYV